MNKIKKILMITSLTTLAAACLMLILAVFKLPIFKGIPLRILLILATTALSCAFAISELGVIKKKRIVGFIGLGLLCISVLMAFIIFCSPLLTKYSVFNRITGIVSILSVAFIIILSIYSKLENTLLGLQIPTYISLAIIVLMLSIIIGGYSLLQIKGMLEVLIIDAIVCAGLLIATSVIASKRKDGDEPKLTEVEKLKQEIQQLKKENEDLKAKLADLQK